MIEFLAWFFSAVLVLATVSAHYETIMLVSDKVVPWAKKRVRARRVIAISIATLMLGHIAEIWMFALALRLLLHFPAFGALQTATGAASWGDFLYLSSVDYTSLGDSDLRIAGPARALAASEALVGMMMIAWSASFTYLKMEQLWQEHRTK